jgi:hypothetical protein
MLVVGGQRHKSNSNDLPGLSTSLEPKRGVNAFDTAKRSGEVLKFTCVKVPFENRDCSIILGRRSTYSARRRVDEAIVSAQSHVMNGT